MFGAPIVTLPHAAHISESAPAFSQPQFRGHFTVILINMVGLFFYNQSELTSSTPESDTTNLGGVSNILHAATYTSNSVHTS